MFSTERGSMTCAPKRAVAYSLSTALILILLLSGFAEAQQLQQPIALDALPSTGIVALEANGRVVELWGKAGDYQTKTTFNIPTSHYPVDLTLAEIGGSFYLFVASNGTRSLGGTLGRVWEYSLDGKIIAYWDLKSVCSGIDYDGRSHNVYVGVSEPNGVYSIH